MGKAGKLFRLCFVIITTALSTRIYSQYVTIPDATFVAWLQSNGYAGCMNGSQLDTTCGAVLNAITVNCNAVPIRDLTGIQYFTNLYSLDCSNDSLYTIPALPPNLIFFNCNNNNLTALPAIPASDTGLLCDFNHLNSLPVLPAGLFRLDCSFNNITSLPTLPSSLHTLDCYNNQISALPVLPSTLTILGCSGNPLGGVFQALPAGICQFYCGNCQLTGLPALPNTIYDMNCELNPGLHSLPALPLALTFFNCRGDSLTALPALPPKLNYLDCRSNLLASLPVLPDSLLSLSADVNPLDSLPPLPATLQSLYVQNCGLTSLPALPAGLTTLDCFINQLTGLPALPDSLYYFRCSINPNLACLPELKRIKTLLFANTAITCLPNYGVVTTSTPPLNSLPLCGIFNPGGCNIYWNISGNTYYDSDINCLWGFGDEGLGFVKMRLDSAGVLIQQVFTGGEGNYSFKTLPGTYNITPDTTNLPFALSCPDSGYLSATITTADSLSYSNNFAFKCRPVGFDIGVQSILNNYTVPRPSDTITINTVAGDISRLYGAYCAAGTAGQVTITFSGQVTYVGPAPGALTPLVSGNTITWAIADFGAVNDTSAFNLLFKIDSLATAGTQVCFTASVTPVSGDFNPANNTLSYCFTIVSSLDPNVKEVYPQGNTDISTQWLTYTIRFQNTGTADAVNIYIMDTLDNNVDPSTFQLLAYSHRNITEITGNIVRFNFPNIYLPDSNTDKAGSHGYVQYKVKLKDNLPAGTHIQNTAFIYFDLNPAVVTNTTSNNLVACAPQTTALTQTICAGQSYQVGNSTYNQAGIYTDTLPGGNGCDSVVNLSLTVNPLPTVTFTWDSMLANHSVYSFPNNNAGVSINGCSPQFIPMLGGSPAGGHYSGLGIVNDTLYPLSINHGSFWPSYDTSLLISYSYTDTNGCDAFAQDTLIAYYCEAINNISGINFSIYPNPANTIAFLSIEGNFNTAKLELMDALGRVFIRREITNSITQLDISGLAPGVYWIRVNQAHDIATIKRLVIK